MKPADERQSGSNLSTPESSSASTLPSTAHPLGLPILPSHWPGLSSEPQWTSGVAPAGQQVTITNANAPAVSLSPGSILPINLLPAELSSLLGMNMASTALSSSAAVGVLLPKALLVSAEGGGSNLLHHDPLTSLSRLSSGLQNLVPVTSTNAGITNDTAQARRNHFGNSNEPHLAKVEPPTETMRSYGSNHCTMLGLHRPTVSILSRPKKLSPDIFSGGVDAYTEAKSDQPVQTPLASESLPPKVTSLSSSMFSLELHRLLQQGSTAGRNLSSVMLPPPYSKVPENTLPAGGTTLSHAVTELTVSSPSSGRRRWTSADSTVSRRQYGTSSRGFSEYPGDDVAVSLFRQESSGFDISKSSSAAPADGSSLEIRSQTANIDRGSSEFSAPSAPGLHHKFRRKNRPQPLIIPSPVGHFGFQSRLRSPRISADQSGPGLPTETSSVAASTATLSIPVAAAASMAGLTPYTPPPMLSPVRTGSGLFYSLIQPSPKSAPVGFRLGLLRCSKFLLFWCK